MAGNVRLLIVLGLIFSTAAQAETPVRCEAVWIGPVKHCGLQGEWAATGVGRREDVAKKNAVSRLLRAVRAAAELDVLRRPLAGTIPARCAAKAEEGVRVTCFPEPSLAKKRHCYVDLKAEGCGALPMFELDGVGWRISEKGRKKMCSAVERHLHLADDATRARCRALCAQDTRVRCPKQ